MNPRGPFICFLALAAMVALGLAILPPLTAASWITDLNASTLPIGLQAAWLAWFFALWGALVAFTLAVGAWTVEELTRSEEQGRAVAPAVPAPGATARDESASRVLGLVQDRRSS